MSDELKISASLDASQLVSGMDQAASAVKDGASQITASLESITLAGQGAEALLQELGASGEAVGALGEQFELFGTNATNLGTELIQAAGGAANFGGAAEDLSIALGNAATGAELLLTSLGAVGETASTASVGIATAAEQLGLFEVQAALASEAMTTLGVGIAAVNGPIADATGQLELFTQAAADSNGQLALFEQTSTMAAVAAEGLAAAQADAARAATQYNVTLGEGVAASAGMATAIEFLNSAEAVQAATSGQVAQAISLLNREAAKLGFVVLQTASGIKVLSASTTEATEKISALQLAMGSGAARIGAMELGMGRMAYAVGGIVRAVGPLASAFAIAFAPIIVVALVEAIDSLIDRFKQMESEIRKTSNAFADFATDAGVKSEDMRLNILKAEDEVRKLHNLPTENKLHEALLENKKAAIELSRALADAGEKALELLEKQEIGFWKSAITGLASTDDLKTKLEPEIQEYIIALQRVQQAKLQGNEAIAEDERIKAHNKRVEIQELLEAELHAIDAKKQALQQSRIENRGGKESFREVPGMTAEEANKFLGPREAAIRSLGLAFEQAAQQEALLNAQETTHLAVANASILAEQTRREFTFSEGDVKNAQKAADQTAAIEKKSAEDSFKEAESSANKQAAAATETGVLREQAELDANDKIMEARNGLTVDLLDAEQKHYEATRANLEKERDAIDKFTLGDVRTKRLKDINAEIERFEKEHSAKVIDIATEGATARDKIDADSAAKRVAIHKKEIQDEVFATREKTRAIVDDAREAEHEQASIIKSNADIALREISILEQERLITVQGAYNARVAIYRQETSDLKAEIEKQKTALEAQQAAIQAQIAALQATDPHSGAIKELTRVYDQLTEAIKKATSAQSLLDTQFKKDVAGAQLTRIADLTKSYDQAFGDMANRFSGMIGSLVSGSDTFIRAWGRMVIQMEVDFIQSLLKMVARHLAAEAAKRTATQVGQAAQTATTATQASLRAAIENTTLFQALKGLILLITHHKVAQAAKTASTAAGKAAQVATETTGDAAIAASNAGVAAAQQLATAATTTTVAAGAAAKLAAVILTNEAIIISEAAVTAAAAFASVMLALPFPANVAAAPGVAIAEATQVLSLLTVGAASQGALLADDALIMAHAEEMILPPDISAGLQGLISAGGMSGAGLSSNLTANSPGVGGTSVSVGVDIGGITAFDSADVTRVLMNNQSALVSAIAAAVRNGLLRNLKS